MLIISKVESTQPRGRNKFKVIMYVKPKKIQEQTKPTEH